MLTHGVSQQVLTGAFERNILHEFRRTQKMKGSKIIATLVVLAMLLSTMVVLNQLNIISQAGAYTPGVNKWGNATTDLEYGVTYSTVYINSSQWTGTGPFYLYFPTYTSGGTGGNANEFNWNGPYMVSGYPAQVTTAGEDSTPIYTGGASISFNRSGMWIFDSDSAHTGDDPTTYAGYIWVNTSTKYTIDSVASFDYGSEGSVTITVNTLNDTGCMIAIMGPDNSTIYHKWRTTGVSEAIGKDNFTMAGDYTVKAYKDLDAQNSTYFYPDEYYIPGGVTENYSYWYGSDYTTNFPSHPLTTGDIYDYAHMGPWDPPEKNATEITFTVDTGKPTIVLTNTSFYWGFEMRIDINVTDADGNGIDVANPIMLKFGSKYVDFSAYITNLGDGNYSLEIPRFDDGPGWTDLATALGNPQVNGTWRIVFGYDANGDGTEEWNNTASFSIKSSNPPVQLVLVDDGSGKATDKKVDIPAYTPTSGEATTIDIVFDIFGRSITNDLGRAYYGDDPWEDWKNITVAGDILYPVNAMTLVWSTKGRWTATVTPTKPGGTITLTIDWPGDDNGTAVLTIEIVNGTNVVPAVDKFTVGSDFNLTVTITDMEGAIVKNAHVYLMWEDVPDEFNDTIGDKTAGNGLNGEYTFWIKPHNKDSTTPDSAPQNITIAAQLYPTSTFWGYATVLMDRNHNMQVNVTPTTSYAGDGTEYDIGVSLIGGGHPSKTGLHVALYNSTGALVTGDDAWSKAGSYDITDEQIVLSGGTYYLYAYNDTSDSRDHNATIIVTKYIVTSSPSILAWKIDTEANMTFTLTPAGNGTLTLNNMTSLPNASYPGQSTQISIENGVGTLESVDATTLGNVTFAYAPEGGAQRDADGLLRVTTATATPNPATIYVGEPSVVTIMVTHPATGAPLEDVRVGLDHGMLLNESILAKIPTDQHTDAAGQVEFSMTADASGNVTIYIENETDPDNAFVIKAVARKQMMISTDASVDEGKTFTVQAKDASGALITGVTVTFTFAGQTWPTTTGVASLVAPAVSTSLTYTITATAEGYTSPSTTIMVINVPKLTIIPPSGDVKGKQKFTVTIANDEGAGVAGATVTFNDQSFYSGANGICELTAPDVTQESAVYQIKATFTGYTPADTIDLTILKTPSVPGFELLTLVAAIGIAFLLLRRRRN
jgi:hypothetical protein